MNIKFIFIDNPIVAFLAFGLTYPLFNFVFLPLPVIYRIILSICLLGMLIVGIGYTLTMIRFWYTPKRKITAKLNEIVSPADGNVLYIKRIEANETPIAVKNGKFNELEELTKTDLLKKPCWLIGINMTAWDVHKNCAPIDGTITLNKYSKGAFHSLKKFEALTQNERNTYIIENELQKLGVVQIASKGVRRIDSYVMQNDQVRKGDWLGMIRFGSQVDVIIPYNCSIKITIGQQIYAGLSVIATS